MKAKLTIPPPQSYWNNTGRFQELAGKLDKLIPLSGSVMDKDKKPCLELFRVASNCYYDLFNNGLCNRSKDFYRVFRFSPFKVFPQTWCGNIAGIDFKAIKSDGRVDRHMDTIIYSAALEQGFIKTPKE